VLICTSTRRRSRRRATKTAPRRSWRPPGTHYQLIFRPLLRDEHTCWPDEGDTLREGFPRALETRYGRALTQRPRLREEGGTMVLRSRRRRAATFVATLGALSLVAPGCSDDDGGETGAT